MCAFDILHDEGLAEDAVHDTFIKISQILYKIDEKSCHKTKSFMVIVVESISKNIYMKRKRHPEHLMNDLDEHLADDIDISDDIISKVDAEVIAGIVNKLDHIDRALLLLRYVNEFEYDEIADVLGIRKSTVGKRIERAKRRVYKAMGEMKK